MVSRGREGRVFFSLAGYCPEVFELTNPSMKAPWGSGWVIFPVAYHEVFSNHRSIGAS